MADSPIPVPAPTSAIRVAVSGLRHEKAKLRAVALQRRAAMGEDARAHASRHAADFALPVILAHPVRCVSLFSAIHDEIDPRPLAASLRERGVELALPEVVKLGQPLTFRHWAPDDPLVPKGRYAIPTPAPDAPVVVPDVVMVPLAAYDSQGFRIGYGAGFYDRTLSLLRAQGGVRAFGFAFSCQQLDHVPHEAHDEPVDWMITQDGAVPCAPSQVI